jgi:hypothetical protein
MKKGRKEARKKLKRKQGRKCRYSLVIKEVIKK